MKSIHKKVTRESILALRLVIDSNLFKQERPNFTQLRDSEHIQYIIHVTFT